MQIGIVIGVVVLVIILWVSIMYNSFVRARNYITESWSQIDVQLIRRSDLIPNLVNTVKGYAKFEQDTLEKVINARNRLTAMSDVGASKDAIMESSDVISSSLKTIFALQESYPDLKSNVQFSSLMEELKNTENKIAYARQLYNTSVVSYNTKISIFPNVLFAGLFGFRSEKVLEANNEQKEAVKVEF